MGLVLGIGVAAVVIWSFAFARAPLWLWTAAAAVALLLGFPPRPSAAGIALWAVFLAVAAVLHVTPLRRRLVSAPLRRQFQRIMPAMSATEREALEAGTVWWEAELFGGRPDWRRLLAVSPPALTPEEQAFIDGPCEELCRLLDDWDISHRRRDLPPEVWRLLKERGFFGMIIPRRYGGLGFSAQAQSAVVMKVASRSTAAAVTVMVPNSLGPAELLLHYGTEEQQNHFLPRLASGEELPCFALTGPEAGSDASSIPDRGVVCRGEFDGRADVLGVRLRWEKRYITLAPVATVIGLAFRMFDPEHLLSEREDLGITLALIPTRTPGVRVGRRHDPLDIVFQNGPTWGEDVFVPIDRVIGGRGGIGQGWRMLMESLAAGRAISLPALATGAGKLACRATGAYARIRQQFNLPIGKFEAVEEVLARIAGYTYMMDAARSFTARAVDLGERPAVASAIVKVQLTEHMRRVVNDAMDIQGGSGICLGPRNLLGRAYQGLPISITVEGANLLTRALIIYGQGAVRCHPYVLAEMRAAAQADPVRGVAELERALGAHLRLVLSNAARALLLGLTGARLARAPVRGAARRYAQRVARLSAAFALVSDAAMLALGGSLRRREKISARLADALSFLYLASAVIKRFEDQGRPPEDLPLMRWAGDYCLHQAENALAAILRNFPRRVLARVLGALVFPAGRRCRAPTDAIGHAAAQVLLAPSTARERLTAGIFVPRGEDEPLGRLELALPLAIAAEPLERVLHRFVEAHPLLLGDPDAQLEAAAHAGVLSVAQKDQLHVFHALRRAVISVDDFAPGEF